MIEVKIKYVSPETEQKKVIVESSFATSAVKLDSATVTGSNEESWNDTEIDGGTVGF